MPDHRSNICMLGALWCHAGKLLLAPRSVGSGQLARPRTRAIAHCNLFVCAAGCNPQDAAIPAARPAHAAGCLRARPRQRLIMLQSAAAANVRRPVLPSFTLLAVLQRQRESHGKQGGVAPDVSHSGMSKYSNPKLGLHGCGNCLVFCRQKKAQCGPK